MSSVFSHERRRDLFGLQSHRDSPWTKNAAKIPLVVVALILLVRIGEPQLWLAAAVAGILAMDFPKIAAAFIGFIAAVWFFFGLLLGVDAFQPNIWLPLGIVAGVLFARNVIGLVAAAALVALTWFFLVALNLRDLPFIGGVVSVVVAVLVLAALVALVLAVIKNANDLSFALILIVWAIVLPQWLVFSYSGFNYSRPAWLWWDLDEVWYLLALIAVGIICWKLLQGRPKEESKDQGQNGHGDGNVNTDPDPLRPLGSPEPNQTPTTATR